MLVRCPSGWKNVPHLKLVHEGCWQSSLMPGHSLSLVHSWHTPRPSQKPGLLPLKVLHGESLACAGFVGVPLVQTSSSQSVEVVGRSLSSFSAASTPAMHT